MRCTGYYVYKIFITYKAHFNSEDGKVYDGIFGLPYDQYLNTRGISYYERISERIKNESTIKSIFITAFLDDPSIWIGDIANDLDKYRELDDIRTTRIASLDYLFYKDCYHLLTSGIKFDDTFAEFAIKKLMCSDIEIESFIILKHIFNLVLDNIFEYEYIYKNKYRRYEMLFKIDTEKYKQILEEVIMKLKG